MTDEPTHNRKRSGVAWTISSIVALLGGYIACYIYMPSIVMRAPGQKYKEYQSKLIAQACVPAAWLEAKVTRNRIQIEGIDSGQDFRYFAEP